MSSGVKQCWRLCVCAILLTCAAHAQTTAAPSSPGSSKPSPVQLAVWPGLAPGETTSNSGRLGDASGNVARITDVTSPQLFVYPLAKPSPGPALLVCPGGGYEILASDLEGSEIARWLNHLGYIAAVLHYRVPKNRAGALQDAQRALSLLRARAGEFGIDPARLGVIGFSAGGHLSARLAVTGTNRSYAPVDAVDQQSRRPDFAMLIYPAYLLFNDGNGIAPDVQPVQGMPPIFLAQALDDPWLSVLPYSEALSKHGVSVHCCVYTKGGHGYGLRSQPDVPAAKWSSDAAHWLLKNFPPDHFAGVSQPF